MTSFYLPEKTADALRKRAAPRPPQPAQRPTFAPPGYQTRNAIADLRARAAARSQSFRAASDAASDADVPRVGLSQVGLQRQAEGMVRADAPFASPFRQREFELGTAALERNRRAQPITDQSQHSLFPAVASTLFSSVAEDLLPENTPRPVRFLVEEATRPANYLTAGLGRPLGLGIRALGGAPIGAAPGVASRALNLGARGAANIVEPIAMRGSLPRVAAAEIAAAAGARQGIDLAEPLLPESGPLRTAGTLGAALAGGGAGFGGLRAAEIGVQGARAAGRPVSQALEQEALRAADPRALEFGRSPYQDVIPRATVVGPRGVELPGASGGADIPRGPGQPYPRIRFGDTVDGRLVRDNIDNTDSIGASLGDDYESVGLREVDVADFPGAAPRDMFYSPDDLQRTRELAEAIRESGEISPLIVAIDAEGPYIIEGAHRLAALHSLGAKSFPALVVEEPGAQYIRAIREGAPPAQPGAVPKFPFGGLSGGADEASLPTADVHVLTTDVIDSDKVPPVEQLRAESAAARAKLTYDSNFNVRPNAQNAALIQRIGEIEAARVMRESMDAADGDPMVAMDSIVEEWERVGMALEYEDTPQMRMRTRNSATQGPRRQAAERARSMGINRAVLGEDSLAIARARSDALTRMVDSFGLEFRPPGGGGGITQWAFDDAKDALMRAVRGEESLRRVGTTAREIREGRARQAGRGSSAIQGVTGEAQVAAARGGMRTGPLRSTFAEPVSLPQEAKDALYDDLRRRYEADELPWFDFVNAATSLQRALDGEGLQPAQIKALKGLFGDEVGETLGRRNAGREPGSMTDAQEARYIQQERARQQRLEAQYVRQGVRAQERANQAIVHEQVDPRIRREALQAPIEAREMQRLAGDINTRAMRERRRSIEAFNKADRSEVDRINAYLERTNARLDARARRAAERDALKENRRPDLSQELEGTDPISVRARFMAGRETDPTPFRAPDAPESGLAPIEGSPERVRSSRAAMTEREEFLERMPNEEMLLQRAAAQAQELGMPEVEELVRVWLDGNRAILDNVGLDPQVIASINAAITGDVADSWLTAALHRKANLSGSLRREGLEDAVVRRIVDPLFNRELQQHYGVERVFDDAGKPAQQLPVHVQELLDSTRNYGYDESLGGLDTFVQRTKNTMFGVDASIFGIQVLNAGRRGLAPILANTINRTLAAFNMPHARLMYADSALSKMQQYGADGVHQGTGASAFDAGTGSILQYFGPAGRAADKPYIRLTDKINEFSFGTILTAVRNFVYEGDLVMLHLAGRNIQDPRVRLVAARNANAIGSFADQAIRKRGLGGSAAQKILLTSPSMTRARVAQITQMARVFTPRATPEERILGAVSIVSTVSGTLMLGTALNNLIGISDFEMDPSKPGFGQITLPGGRIVDVIPQDSVERAFARSIREIAENQDPVAAARAWGNMLLGSASIVGRAAGAVARTGYEPGAGYRYGDMTNKGVILNLAPMPPIIASMWTRGIDGVGMAMDAFGVTNFPESSMGATERLTGGLTGVPARQALDASGDLDRIMAQREEELRELADRGDRKSNALLISFDTRDKLTDLATSVGDDRQAYRAGRRPILDRAAGAREQYQDVFDSFGESDDPVEIDAGAWFDLFDQAKGPGGNVDYERFEALEAQYMGEIGAERFSAVMRLVNAVDPLDNPLEQEYQQVRQQLDETGYFDLKDRVWAQVAATDPALSQFATAYDFRDAVVAQVLSVAERQGLDPTSGATQTMALDIANGMRPLEVWSGVSNDVEQGWITANPQLADQAVAWGYIGGLRGEEMGTLLQQQLAGATP